MREFRVAIAAIAAMGCGSGDNAGEDSGGTPPSCEYQTAPLSSVDSTQWPDGLTDSLSAYQALDGIWTAADCLDPSVRHEFKITAPPQEQLEIIQGGASSSPCGCTQDPVYDHDNTMNPVALVPTLDVFVPIGVFDVGVEARTYAFTGALFGPGQPLSLRACADRRIDPAENSAYDDAWLTIRVDTDDRLAMSIKLARLGEGDQTVTCEITDWVKRGG